MKKTICDKCGKELRESEALELYIDGFRDAPEEYFDLCPECREKLLDWLAGCCSCKQEKAGKQEKAAKAEKPAKKKTWSMNELAEKFGRTRRTVIDALKKLSPHPEKTREHDPVNKARWWYEYKITDPQMKELARRFKGGSK
ncbi:MAG: HTH domain-containing protein [Victivallales bacterium]|nr:HTH domain-containing protein [Victivallales bacterium]